VAAATTVTAAVIIVVAAGAATDDNGFPGFSSLKKPGGDVESSHRAIFLRCQDGI